jgi:hypothetical protein
MDPLTIATSIGGLLTLSVSLLRYLNHVKNAPKERLDCASEVADLYKELLSIQSLHDEKESGPWLVKIGELARSEAFDQCKNALEELEGKLTPKRGLG